VSTGPAAEAVPSAPLLVELLTEELPPKSLMALGEAFAAGIHQGLVLHDLADADPRTMRSFASPRRLAVLVEGVRSVAPEREFTQKLMPVSVGLDAQGQPTPALLRKLYALGCPQEPPGIAQRMAAQLAREGEGRQQMLVYHGVQPGSTLAFGLQSALLESIEQLPIARAMSYQLADGVTTVEFVRPVHALVAVHGGAVVDVHALGMRAARTTAGHRFHAPGPLVVESAEGYEPQLRDQGRVLASFAARRDRIVQQLQAAAAAQGAQVIMPDALVDEVTALVEWPVVYESGFDAQFLELPQSCLVLTMQQNQKVFALREADGRLRNRFLLVANIEAADPSAILAGNARVVRARLADAKFFFEQDLLQRLDARPAAAARVVYHQKLGSQLQRIERLVAIAGTIADTLDASGHGPGSARGGAGSRVDTRVDTRVCTRVDASAVRRAAFLAKADLDTLMVGEFPELQGEIGAIYARIQGENETVVAAIDEHYRPRFAGDALPQSPAGACVALADKLEILAGLFGAGERPSGDRDPYALRRNALGVLRILQERALPLELPALVALAFDAFYRSGSLPEGNAPAGFERCNTAVEDFLYERLRGMLQDEGYGAREVDAVLSLRPGRIDSIGRRMAAVRAFMQLPEAQNLAAANKRIANLLKKAPPQTGDAGVDPELLLEPAERALASAHAAVAPRVDAALAAGDDTALLRALAPLRAPVDRFFEEVMVMAEEPALRANRLALLAGLRKSMNRIADISLLAAA
jgi:glycyl-tRNA synthetase beta chain